MIPRIDIEPGSSALERAFAGMCRLPGSEHLLVLLQAVKAGEIGLTIIVRHREVWSPRLLHSSLPRVLLIGDDAGDSRDPSEWRCAMSAMAWARSAVVHGTGAKPDHYKIAIELAVQTGKCLLVETDSDHAPVWADGLHAPGFPLFLFIPPGGGTHPSPSASETMGVE